VALADEPLVLLLDDDAGGESEQTLVVGAPRCAWSSAVRARWDDVGEVAFEGAAGFAGALAFG
jgi:hypothetical protein